MLLLPCCAVFLCFYLPTPFMPYQPLRTERLLLCPTEPDHAEAFLAYYLRNKDHFSPWIPTWPSDFFTLQYQRKRLEEQWRAMKRGEEVRFCLLHRQDADGSYLLGDIAYTEIRLGPLRRCELGYKIDQRVIGHGLATEALRAANAFVIAQFDLVRIEAFAMPNNTASTKLLERLGFEAEGVARSFLEINGLRQDHLRYAYLHKP
jgi:ribosomal-protein-alanine N-acetyltransferase